MQNHNFYIKPPIPKQEWQQKTIAERKELLATTKCPKAYRRNRKQEFLDLVLSAAIGASIITMLMFLMIIC
jgi:hypothetical protein